MATRSKRLFLSSIPGDTSADAYVVPADTTTLLKSIAWFHGQTVGSEPWVWQLTIVAAATNTPRAVLMLRASQLGHGLPNFEQREYERLVLVTGDKIRYARTGTTALVTLAIGGVELPGIA